MSGRILLFIPAYNCAPQIGRVLDQAEAGWVRANIAKVIVVDNRSPDETAAVVAGRIRSRGDDFIALLRNEANYGLGGSHKVAFRYALQHGFDWVIVLHGDDQGTLADLRPHLEDRSFERVDCLLGSRFMPGARLAGYSAFRRLGNAIFNALYSVSLGKQIADLGSGLNLYRVSALGRTNYFRAPDNLTFNCVLLASQVIAGCRIRFVPISWREDDQVSNVKLVRQATQTLRIALRALFRRGAFLDLDHRERPVADYASVEVHAGA
jgi:glycosyltransferase involved in cell wall biosynthesis